MAHKVHCTVPYMAAQITYAANAPKQFSSITGSIAYTSDCGRFLIGLCPWGMTTYALPEALPKDARYLELSYIASPTEDVDFVAVGPGKFNMLCGNRVIGKAEKTDKIYPLSWCGRLTTVDPVGRACITGHAREVLKLFPLALGDMVFHATARPGEVLVVFENDPFVFALFDNGIGHNLSGNAAVEMVRKLAQDAKDPKNLKNRAAASLSGKDEAPARTRTRNRPAEVAPEPAPEPEAPRARVRRRPQ